MTPTCGQPRQEIVQIFGLGGPFTSLDTSMQMSMDESDAKGVVVKRREHEDCALGEHANLRNSS